MFDDLMHLKTKGNERAATAWEKLTAVAPPIDPINIYKAVCSIKCAEMLARFRSFDSANLADLITIIADFMEATIAEAGGASTGDKADGMRAVTVIEGMFPFAEQDFNDPSLFAIRMHTLDGVMLLSAEKFGKEQETKGHIETMQKNFLNIVLRDVMGMSDNAIA
jgi:hypothetical protein